MKGLDLSFAVPPAAWWADRHDDGWRVAVQDAWTGISVPGQPTTTLARARTAGFVTAAYTVVNLLPGAESVAKAKAACGTEWGHLNFVAIDVEVAGISWAQYKKAISEAEAALKAEGKRPVIYTARWFWVGHLGNPTDFRHLPLWNAYYDGDPDIDFPANPYGGWATVMGEQYQGTTSLGGYSVDLNTFSDEFIEEEDMATIAELEAAIAQLRTDATKGDNAIREALAALRADATGADNAIRARLDALEAKIGVGVGYSDAQAVKAVREKLG